MDKYIVFLIFILIMIIFIAGFKFAFHVYGKLYKSAGNMVVAPYKGLIQSLGVTSTSTESTVKPEFVKKEKKNGLTFSNLVTLSLIIFVSYSYIAPYLVIDAQSEKQENNLSNVNTATLVKNINTNPKNVRRKTKKVVNKKPKNKLSNAEYNDQERLKKAKQLVLSLENQAKEFDNISNVKESSSFFYIKIAVYSNYTLLEEKGERLEEYGLTPVVQTIEIEGENMYRLYVGIFEDNHAEEWLVYLRQEGWNPEKVLNAKAESDGNFYSI